MIKIHLSRLMGERKEKLIDVMRSTGLSRNTVAGFYNETTARIDLVTLDALCEHFQCTVGDLIEYLPEPERSAN